MNDSPIADLIKLLARLPGIGAKSGARLAYFLVDRKDRYPEELARAILEVRENVRACPVCGTPSTTSPCHFCQDQDRDHSTIMVVETPQDQDAVESTKKYQGLYHVLGGTLSPMAGKGPDSLRIKELTKRLENEALQEIIIATNPSSEGVATAAYLTELIQNTATGLSITRLARGVPAGADIKYSDPLSLELAISERK
ncbi:MAG: recombination mediator RecR [bacterium]